MRIAHLSDFHLTDNPDEKLHRIFPFRNLETAVSCIRRHKPLPDMLVLGGDIFENGELANFGIVTDLIANLQIPCHAVMGNHDDLQQMTKAFHLGWDERSLGYYSFSEQGVHVIILNSSGIGKAYGHLEDEQLRWLAEDLEKSGSTKSLIFMHHHAFESGIVWLDQIKLLNDEDFWRILRPYVHNILGLFSAHLHRPFLCSFNGVVSVGCPAVSWQFSGRTDAVKGELSEEPSGFNLIDVSEAGFRVQTIRFSVYD